jgi:hypothetical protein
MRRSLQDVSGICYCIMYGICENEGFPSTFLLIVFKIYVYLQIFSDIYKIKGFRPAVGTVTEESKDYFATRYWAPREKKRCFATRYWALKNSNDYFVTRYFPHKKILRLNLK